MTIYIKPMTWAGKTKFYLGLQPSNPKASPGHQLGSYFLVLDTWEGAHFAAEAEARRSNTNVVECAHYVGFELKRQQSEPAYDTNWRAIVDGGAL